MDFFYWKICEDLSETSLKVIFLFVEELKKQSLLSEKVTASLEKKHVIIPSELVPYLYLNLKPSCIRKTAICDEDFVRVLFIVNAFVPSMELTLATNLYDKIENRKTLGKIFAPLESFGFRFDVVEYPIKDRVLFAIKPPFRLL